MNHIRYIYSIFLILVQSSPKSKNPLQAFASKGFKLYTAPVYALRATTWQAGLDFIHWNWFQVRLHNPSASRKPSNWSGFHFLACCDEAVPAQRRRVHPSSPKATTRQAAPVCASFYSARAGKQD